MERVRNGARAIVAVIVKRAVAAAPNVRLAPQRVRRPDGILHVLRRPRRRISDAVAQHRPFARDHRPVSSPFDLRAPPLLHCPALAPDRNRLRIQLPAQSLASVACFGRPPELVGRCCHAHPPIRNRRPAPREARGSDSSRRVVGGSDRPVATARKMRGALERPAQPRRGPRTEPGRTAATPPRRPAAFDAVDGLASDFGQDEKNQERRTNQRRSTAPQCVRSE